MYMRMKDNILLCLFISCGNGKTRNENLWEAIKTPTRNVSGKGAERLIKLMDEKLVKVIEYQGT